MKMKLLTPLLFLSFVLCWVGVQYVFCADLEWTIKKQLNLEAAPLDISVSADGRWIYILVPGHVLVYSSLDDKVIKRIPVDQSFGTLTYYARKNSLILGSRSNKTLRIIQLELIHDIDISGLPFRGPPDASVVIAVFCDYQ